MLFAESPLTNSPFPKSKLPLANSGMLIEHRDVPPRGSIRLYFHLTPCILLTASICTPEANLLSASICTPDTQWTLTCTLAAFSLMNAFLLKTARGLSWFTTVSCISICLQWQTHSQKIKGKLDLAWLEFFSQTRPCLSLAGSGVLNHEKTNTVICHGS